MGMIKRRIEPGMKYGMLTAIKDAKKKDSKGESMWLFRCDCGKEKEIRASRVVSGGAKSCGCKSSRLTNSWEKHGLYKTDLYKRWKAMNSRCAAYDDVHQKRYLERNIKVCNEWREFLPFYEWAISNGYRKDLTLDRIDNNGDYDPSNCRWATIKQQANNKENTIRITWNGEERPLSEWAELLNIKRATLYRRYRKGETGNYLFREVNT